MYKTNETSSVCVCVCMPVRGQNVKICLFSVISWPIFIFFTINVTCKLSSKSGGIFVQAILHHKKLHPPPPPSWIYTINENNHLQNPINYTMIVVYSAPGIINMLKCILPFFFPLFIPSHRIHSNGNRTSLDILCCD